MTPAIAPQTLSPKQRAISAAEVLLGAFFVIGHNVFRVVPNEVYFLFALFWISFGLRERTWKPAGLVAPRSWAKTLLIAVIAAAVLQLGSGYIVEPLAHHLWPAPEKVSEAIQTATLSQALLSLLLVWTFAAFGEELGYRGFLLNRAADVGNRTRASYIVAMVVVAVLFGIGHWYKGPAGVIDSTYSGLVLGAVYLLSGRNLWAPVLTHGISDTIAVVAVFAGWAS